MDQQKKSYFICSVDGCVNSTLNAGLSFFKLPPVPERRIHWLKLIQREDLINTSCFRARVCEAHFKPNTIKINSKRKLLKKNSIPQLLLPSLNFETKGTQTTRQIGYILPIEYQDLKEAGPALPAKSPGPSSDRDHMPRNKRFGSRSKRLRKNTEKVNKILESSLVGPVSTDVLFESSDEGDVPVPSNDGTVTPSSSPIDHSPERCKYINKTVVLRLKNSLKKKNEKIKCLQDKCERWKKKLKDEENLSEPLNDESTTPSTPQDYACSERWKNIYKKEVQRLKTNIKKKNYEISYLQVKCKRWKEQLQDAESARAKRTDENDITVFCPKCNSEVSHTAEGIQLDQTKIIVAKVYHYFEQEYEELKKTFVGIEQTPLSMFRQRTALATGVSETMVMEILQEEARRNEEALQEQARRNEEALQEQARRTKEMQQQALRQQRRARKRPRLTDSSIEDGSSDENNATDNADNIADDDDETETLVIKEEPVESCNEEPEVYLELPSVKVEPGEYGDNTELTDPMPVDLKTEPLSEDEATTSSETTAVQRDTQSSKKKKTKRQAVAPPAASTSTTTSAPSTSFAPPAAAVLPGISAPPETSILPERPAPPERRLILLEDGEVKMEKIEIGEEGFS